MQVTDIPAALQTVGVAGTLRLLISRRKLQALLPYTASLTLKGYSAPFAIRSVATDKYVFADVFLKRQYDCVLERTNVRTIVDLGANIGATSVFLLHAYPEARIISVEPDPGNFELLARNLAPYGTRATALRRAVWSNDAPFAIDRGHFRDGGEWSFQVRTAETAAAEVDGITIRQLLDRFELESVDILKMDIEGAERIVLRDTSPQWLDAVRLLAIELHDDACYAEFDRAIAGRAGQRRRAGEVTLWEPQ